MARRIARYWETTTGSDRPHLTPAWGAWIDTALWFSCSPGSRKAPNLGVGPGCTVATDDPHQPVVLEGRASLVSDPTAVAAFAADAKYETAYGAEFYIANACFRGEPDRVFALDDTDFTGTPTRWVFAPSP